MNMKVQETFQSTEFIYFKYIYSVYISKLGDNSIFNFWTTFIMFPQWWYQFTVQKITLSPILANIYLLFFDNSYPNRCEVVSH